MIEFLIEVFQENSESDALIFNEKTYSYGWLLDQILYVRGQIESNSIPRGATVGVEGDFNPYSISWLLSLIENRNIVIPLSRAIGDKRAEFLGTAEVEYLVNVEKSKAEIYKTTKGATHSIYQKLRDANTPGLVLFSSGSTGKSKAAVHDFSFLLNKFKVRKQQKRILAFLLFDHIGGINTLLYTLSNGGCLVTTHDRTPERIAEIIDRYKVQILPTSPTFLNLLLLRNVFEKHSLSTLETITYGTEVMSESTLQRVHQKLPMVKLQQTYGLSEVGILRSQSEANDSLWVRIGGEGFETRVVDDLLEIKAESAMLGYLNAPSPFTDDGWFKTGDAVEVKGDYFKILGRKSEIINVGGEKVYPAEVESLILSLDGVEDVIVSGEKNPILGNIVVARVCLKSPEDQSKFKIRLRKYLSSKCEAFKIPQKIVVSDRVLHSARFKKLRNMGDKQI